jgi:hypothetical protein
MADYVREIMEKMVAPLRDLQRHGIFSEAELASIVDRREEFEYGLRKRQVDKVRNRALPLRCGARSLARSLARSVARSLPSNFCFVCGGAALPTRQNSQSGPCRRPRDVCARMVE